MCKVLSKKVLRLQLYYGNEFGVNLSYFIECPLHSDIELSRRPLYLIYSGSFRRNKITWAPFVELKEPPLFTTLWILNPNSGVLVPSEQSNWAPSWKESLFMKKIVLVANTKRDKQHFWFSYNKTFKAINFTSPQKKLHKSIAYKKKVTQYSLVRVKRDRVRKGRMNLIYLDGIRETTTDLCYRHINLKVCFLSFVDKIIWIRKESISISWFWLDQQDSTSHFHSVWHFYLTTQNVFLPSGLFCQKMSISDCWKMLISL